MDFSSLCANLHKTASRTAAAAASSSSSSTTTKRSRNEDPNHNPNNNHNPNDPLTKYPKSTHWNQNHPNNPQDYWLHRFVQRIPEYQPVPPRIQRRKQRHVAILFLTIDDLPFENLWRDWLESSSFSFERSPPPTASSTSTTGGRRRSKKPIQYEAPMVSILCHAKYPDRVTSPWLRKRLLVSPSLDHLSRHHHRHHPRNHHHHHHHHQNQNQNHHRPKYHTRKPEWGSVEITQAMIDLLEEALRIGTSKTTHHKHTTTTTTHTHHHDPDTTTHDEHPYSLKRYISANAPKPKSAVREVIPTVDRFLFCSETCLPVSTLAELEYALFGNRVLVSSSNTVVEPPPPPPPGGSSSSTSTTHNIHSSSTGGSDVEKSWVNIRSTPNNGYAKQLQFDVVHSSIQPTRVRKADQWMVLTRRHAWPIVSLVEEACWATIDERERENRGSRREFGNGSERRGGGRGGGGGGRRRGGGRGGGGGGGRSGGWYDRRGGERIRGGGGGTTDRDVTIGVGGHNNGGWSASSPLTLWHCFRDVKASDEMYFPTAMSLLGIVPSSFSALPPPATTASDGTALVPSESTTTVTPTPPAFEEKKEDYDECGTEVAKRRVTYCDWSVSVRNPATIVVSRNDNFRDFRAVVRLAREEGCLFARKFEASVVGVERRTEGGVDDGGSIKMSGTGGSISGAGSSVGASPAGPESASKVGDGDDDNVSNGATDSKKGEEKEGEEGNLSVNETRNETDKSRLDGGQLGKDSELESTNENKKIETQQKQQRQERAFAITGEEWWKIISTSGELKS